MRDPVELRRILITGSSGVLGTGFKSISGDYNEHEFLYSKSTDCDLTDPIATTEYVSRLVPDAIIHLAAISGGVAISRANPATLLRDNILMLMNVLESARVHQIPKVILTLSSGIYPSNVPTPFTEGVVHDGPADESNYGYSFAKRLMEPAIRAYRAEFGMNVIGVVPNGILGEHDKYNESAVMLAALIRRFHENINTEEEIVIWGDGSPLREYTYAPDLARAFMWCLKHYNEPEILNIGSVEECSVAEYAYMIADIMCVDRGRITFDITKPAGVYKKSTDNSNFIRLSKFQYTPVKEALENTVRWFQENYDIPGKVRL